MDDMKKAEEMKAEEMTEEISEGELTDEEQLEQVNGGKVLRELAKRVYVKTDGSKCPHCGGGPLYDSGKRSYFIPECEIYGCRTCNATYYYHGGIFEQVSYRVTRIC